MSEPIPAVFAEGVFRPLQPVDLAEGTPVTVQVQISSGSAELSPSELSSQRVAIVEFLERMESLPEEGPNDGFSGRDHDKVLYGAP